MSIVYVMLIFTVVFFVDTWPLVIHKKRRDLTVSSLVLISGFILALLYVFEIELPSILVMADDFMVNVLHLNYSSD